MGLTGMKYDFCLIFTTKRCFSVKPKAAPLDFESKLDIFQNLKKNIDNIIMSNRARIWILTCFRCEHTFLVKPMTTPFGFEPKLDILLKSQKIVYNTIMSNRARIWASQG
jgi:hypothetical protein